LIGELTARRHQAFAGATSLPYPVLDQDYCVGTGSAAALPA
jgi:hypothetical protein